LKNAPFDLEHMLAIRRFEDEAKRTYGADHEIVCALARHPFETVPTSSLN
jgi:hypothetical protein